MTPTKNQYIKCILKNNLMIEGIVEEWSDGKSVLRSLDGKSISIIQRSAEDIVVIKVMLDAPTNLPQIVEARAETEDKFQQAYQESSADHLRLKKLAELRKEMAKQDKKIISEKIKDHTITNTAKAKYGYPGFFQIKSP